MICYKVKSLLSAYIDGELSEDEYRYVTAHLQRCAACRKEQQELLTTKRLLSSLRVKAPRCDIPEQIARRLDTQIGPSVAQSFNWQQFLRELFAPPQLSPRFTVLVATLCLLLAFLVYRKHHQPATILWHSGGNTIASTFTNDTPTSSDNESPSYTYVPTQPVTYQNAEPILPLHPETLPSSLSIFYHQRFLPFTFPNH